MKVAVYAIAKDEAANVARFVEGAREADCVVVTDTGSSDGTVALLREHGALTHETLVTPWRFDAARNEALRHVPGDVDVCVSADLDESLQPGWRAALEAAWTPGTSLGSYEYVAEMRDGSPVTTAWRTKVHARHGFAWSRPIHEVIGPVEGESTHVYIPGFRVLHHRESPADYLAPLDALIAECPDDANAYLQRAAEHMKRAAYDAAVTDLERFVVLSPADDALTRSQRALAWVDIARARQASGGDGGVVLRALLRAVADCPESREAWTYLADAWSRLGQWGAAYGAGMQAWGITQRGPGAHDEQCWGDVPKRIADAAYARLVRGAGNGR